MVDKIEISEVQIVPVKPRNGLVAFASCIFNNQLYLGSIAIYTRLDGNGFRLVYPAKTLPNGKQINCVYPINREVGREIEIAIVTKFEELIRKSKEDLRNGKKAK